MDGVRQENLICSAYLCLSDARCHIQLCWCCMRIFTSQLTNLWLIAMWPTHSLGKILLLMRIISLTAWLEPFLNAAAQQTQCVNGNGSRIIIFGWYMCPWCQNSERSHRLLMQQQRWQMFSFVFIYLLLSLPICFSFSFSPYIHTFSFRQTRLSLSAFNAISQKTDLNQTISYRAWTICREEWSCSVVWRCSSRYFCTFSQMAVGWPDCGRGRCCLLDSFMLLADISLTTLIHSWNQDDFRSQRLRLILAFLWLKCGTNMNVSRITNGCNYYEDFFLCRLKKRQYCRLFIGDERCFFSDGKMLPGWCSVHRYQCCFRWLLSEEPEASKDKPATPDEYTDLGRDRPWRGSDFVRLLLSPVS